MNSVPNVRFSGLFKVNKKVKIAELIVVAKANPIFLDNPINPDTTLTSPFGALFITEVPFETVKAVREPAAIATRGTIKNKISSVFLGNIMNRIARDITNILNEIAPIVVDFFASTFSAKNPANGPIIAIASGGTTINIPV